jgi:hypothetical protein
MTANDLGDLRAQLDGALIDERLRLPERHPERIAIICAILSEAFRRRGMRVTLVGGGAIEFHLPDAYASDDTDVEWDQTGHGGHGAQAIVMIRSWRDLDSDRLEHLLRVERAEDAYRALVALASSERDITQETLDHARAALRKGASRWNRPGGGER